LNWYTWPGFFTREFTCPDNAQDKLRREAPSG
jgi:hypothetical protein